MAGAAIDELKKTLGDKKLILSYHNFESIPDMEFLKEKLKLMSAYSPDVYKIACMPKSGDDIHTLYTLQEYFAKEYKDKDFIFIAMGELGKETRITMPQK